MSDYTFSTSSASDTTNTHTIVDGGNVISIDDAGGTVTVDGTVTANLSATDNAVLDTIDAVLDTIKVDTEAIETAVESSADNTANVLTLKRSVIAPVTGLDVNIKPSTSSYLSHVYLDLDATGDNPTANTEVIAAPGSGNKLVIYGVQGSIASGAASNYGNWYLTDGNAADATTLWTGRTQGVEPTHFSITFTYGVALTDNTALKVTSTEGTGNIFINAVVYYRTEAT